MVSQFDVDIQDDLVMDGSMKQCDISYDSHLL